MVSSFPEQAIHSVVKYLTLILFWSNDNFIISITYTVYTKENPHLIQRKTPTYTKAAQRSLLVNFYSIWSNLINL